MSTIDQRTQDRFWTKVAKTDTCWNWTSQLGSGGRYGRMKIIPCRYVRAHRLSWEIHNGPIPHGLCVCHRCDNTKCVRPDHLFLGTRKDNTADMLAKDRQAKHQGEKHPQAKLTDAQVVVIKGRLRSGDQQKDIASDYGVSFQTINSIAKGRKWTHIK